MKQNEQSRHILKSFERQKLMLKRFEEETIADIKHNLINFPHLQNYMIYAIMQDFDSGTYVKTIRSFDFTNSRPAPEKISNLLFKYISTLNQNTLMVISTVPIVEMKNLITNEDAKAVIISVQNKMMLFSYIMSYPEDRPEDLSISSDVDIHPELFPLISHFVNTLKTN